jgi:hypothetical protein
MKYIKLYEGIGFKKTLRDESELKDLLFEIARTNWETVKNPEKVYSSESKYAFTLKLNGRFTALILIRVPGDGKIVNGVFLEDSDNDSTNYMDNLFDPYIYSVWMDTYSVKKYTSFAEKICRKQIDDYYNKLDKMPTEDILRSEILTDFSDNGIEYDVKYGFASIYRLKVGKDDPECVYHKHKDYDTFVCQVVFYGNSNKEEIKSSYEHLGGILSNYGNFNIELYYNKFYNNYTLIISLN